MLSPEAPFAGTPPLERNTNEFQKSAIEHSAKALEQFYMAMDALLDSDRSISAEAVRICEEELRLSEQDRQAWMERIQSAEAPQHVNLL